jgi:hypothetical protein
MQLKTIRGEEITQALKRVIPTAKVVVLNGVLNSLIIDNVCLQVGAYSVDTALVQTKKVWIGVGEFRKQPLRFVADTEEDLQKQMKKFNSDNPSPVTFTITTEEIVLD